MFSVVGFVVVGAMVGQSPDTSATGSTHSRTSRTSQGADHQARLVVSQVFPVPHRWQLVHGERGSDLVKVARQKQKG